MKIKIKCSGICKALLSPVKALGDVLTGVLATILLVSGLALVCIQAPSMHKTWLKHSVGKSVYMIVKTDANNKVLGGGTGFQVVAPSGAKYILTNAHVCEMYSGDDTAIVKMHDGRLLPRHIIEISSETDLCLIEGMPGVDGLKVAKDANPGDTISVIGHPELMPLTLSQGEILAEEHVEFPYAMILPDETPDSDMPPETMKLAQCHGAKFHPADLNTFFGTIKVCVVGLDADLTTAVTFPGNSGSPAVDGTGHVEGVLFAGDGETHYGMLIPLHSIKDFLTPY